MDSIGVDDEICGFNQKNDDEPEGAVGQDRDRALETGELHTLVRQGRGLRRALTPTLILIWKASGPGQTNRRPGYAKTFLAGY